MASILIIDDDDAVRGLLRSVLEAEGYEVTEAANGRQGLNQYRLKPTDLVITDNHMPEMNGLVMLRELTREFPDATVIAISGGGEKERPGCRDTPRGPADLPEALEHGGVAPCSAIRIGVRQGTLRYDSTEQVIGFSCAVMCSRRAVVSETRLPNQFPRVQPGRKLNGSGTFVGI